jgi:hypothetical protein
MLLFSIVLLGSIAGPPRPSVVSAEPVPALDAKFARSEGWVGGDGACSVTLHRERTLWLFSDTWCGKVQGGKRRDVVMVNNSVAVQEGAGNDFRVDSTVSTGADGKPRSLFAPPDGRGWFWIYAGLHANDGLLVFLPRFEKANKPGAFGFRAVDLWLGTVANPDQPPSTWSVSYNKVPFGEFSGDRKRSYGSAVLRAQDQVFIYGYDEKPARPFPARRLLVARAPANRLADFEAWRFLASGDWVADAHEATGLCDGLATEFSVSYLASLKQFALVYTDHGLSDRILGRFSVTPTGPWSEPVLLFTCPEMKRDRKVFCYAAKAHPHLGKGDELVISYVVNSFDLGPVLDNADLYWPRFIRVTLK